MSEIQEIKLYNGEVTLLYDDDKHTYTDKKTGKILNGTTSILKVVDKSHALVPWAVKMDLEYMKVCLMDPELKLTEERLDELVYDSKKAHERYRDTAAEFGTLVHSLVEEEIKGLSPKTKDPLAKKRLDDFRSVTKDMGFDFVDSERIIMSRKKKYCGTLDALGYYEGEMYVLDIKTNTVKTYPNRKPRSGIYNTYWYQTAAYMNAVQEEDEIELAGRIIIRIGEDGVEVGIVKGQKEFKKDLKAFLAAQTLYNRNNELKG